MSMYIVSTIVFLLIALVGYAFLSHSLEKRRAQRLRLLAALKTRERNFKYVVTGLPPHFLSPDLNSLVYRALIETCEQLAKLNPDDPTHSADATLYSAQLSAIKQAPEQRVRLENPAQIKEVRQHLQELYRFVAQQEARKQISNVQAAAYGDQIKRLVLQISVDAYIVQAKQAQQAGKLRLAIHFFNLARKLFVNENANHSYDKQIGQLHITIAKLEEAAGQKPSESEAIPANEENAEEATINKEWEQFGDDDWKKKQVYD